MAAAVQSDDDEDYMSDAFLAQLTDTRPGLVSQDKARQYKQEEKHKELNQKHRAEFKPRKVLESEKRQEGLRSAITQENKGFALLSKMGYKPGMAIGKMGTGRKDPIPVEVKLGRGGLGRDEELKRKQHERVAMKTKVAERKRRKEEELRGDFRKRMTSKFVDKAAERDLYKSQKVCEQLDAQKGITAPKLTYFWPPNLAKKPRRENLDEEEGYSSYIQEEETEEEEEEDGIELDATEKLAMITSYIRSIHLYCVWCGTMFNDEDDLLANCPGNTAEAHDE